MTQAQQGNPASTFGRIVARAWTDETFKQRLLAEPAAVLKEYGIELPDGVQVQVHEASATEVHMVLPIPPDNTPPELSDEQLAAVAGGGFGNFLGQNTPAIAANEAPYGEMWAQDVAAMGGYHSGASAG